MDGTRSGVANGASIFERGLQIGLEQSVRIVRLASGPLVLARICENNVDDYCDWFLLVSPFSKASLGAEGIRVADSRQVDLGDDEGTGRRRVTRLCGRR
jgi:hypothetical protein